MGSTYVLTNRTLHRTVLTLDDNNDPDTAVCDCGAIWSPLEDPPATEWAHTHLSPPPFSYSRILAVRTARRRVINELVADDWKRRTAGNPLIVSDHPNRGQ